MKNILKTLNFFINLLLLMYEFDTHLIYRGEYLLGPKTRDINRVILDNLYSVLRNDIVFITTKNTKTIFNTTNELNTPNEFNELVMVTKGNTTFNYSSISIPSLDKNQLYFFIEPQTKKFISKFKEYDLECVDYEYSLNYSTGRVISDLFINLFINLSKKVSQDGCSYGETYFSLTKYSTYREVKLSNLHVGVIHHTQYYNSNELYSQIESHFINFYKNIPLNSIFLDLSEKYITSLINLMVSKNILKEGIINALGVVEELFPFEFYKDITKRVEKNTFITGGICFDRILKKNKLSQFVNKEIVQKVGSRFIMTGCLRKNNDYKREVLYLELIN